ncbi:uncharacterized protein PGTG_00322 [Puccinia graminis f. sp. tritici CRL 75-36-700-3]|uniref:Uncharacterized protein n=1 Tax=Puccinia graminis f. sp. tritici (strain CRL 75-36-700-3 / race SCCL) TaxID=418459 RepID=E3JQ76_PUCGT|nr:uncharacterized protein PGTG_00322 [Puccinia graminis f. sp. tritici CRL 75-36-700-3]EFP74366.1 hypothetical protein PGTG_00322 [Puccinia graminis f. sp. tritici CRL 75-36-700-3]
MSHRKRQRPSARDFIDRPAPQAPVIEDTPHPINFALLTTPEGNAQPEEYLKKLEEFNEHEQTIELIKGKDKFDLTYSSSNDHHLYIIKSPQHDNKIKDVLDFQHIATLLWGPGKREVADGKAIYRGLLSCQANDKVVTTEEVYAIKFSSQRSAELASGIVEFSLNNFLMSRHHSEDKPSLLIQTKIGSTRWFMKDCDSPMVEADWRVIRKQTPYLRPLTKPEESRPQQQNHLPENDRLAFEISYLPSSFDIPRIIDNLLQLKLLDLPTQIKMTKESNSETPIRILLRFSDPTSAVISKINLFKFGLKSEENETVTFLTDDGDSSIDDKWKIWSNAIVWDEPRIKAYVQSQNQIQAVKSEDEIDELDDQGETKVSIVDSECPDSQKFFESSDEFSDQPHSRPPKQSSSRAYVQSIRQRQACVERTILRLTVEVEKDYLEQKAQDDGKPRSKFYNISEQVGDDRKYNKLMKQLARRRLLRRQLKNHRKIKDLPVKVKQQRKEWRKEQRQKFRDEVIESGDESSGEDSDDSSKESNDSDEPDDQHLATCPQEEWEQIRKKQRIRRVMEEQENSPGAKGKDPENVRLFTNDEIYKHKFARPHEPGPGDLE